MHVHDVQLAAACHCRLGHVTFREVVLGAIASMCRRTLEKHGAFFIVFDLFLCGAILYHTPVNRARSVIFDLALTNGREAYSLVIVSVLASE